LKLRQSCGDGGCPRFWMSMFDVVGFFAFLHLVMVMAVAYSHRWEGVVVVWYSVYSRPLLVPFCTFPSLQLAGLCSPLLCVESAYSLPFLLSFFESYFQSALPSTHSHTHIPPLFSYSQSFFSTQLLRRRE